MYKLGNAPVNYVARMRAVIPSPSKYNIRIDIILK